MTEIVAVLNEIDRGVEKMSEMDIRRAQRALGKMQSEEKPLGTIHNENLKKLWALAHRYDIRTKEAVIESQMADTAEAAAEVLHAGERHTEMEHLCREAFWIQVKDELGPSTREVEHGLGVREDWMVVAVDAKSAATRAIAAVIAKLGQ